jgi:hypothetical protein
MKRTMAGLGLAATLAVLLLALTGCAPGSATQDSESTLQAAPTSTTVGSIVAAVPVTTPTAVPPIVPGYALTAGMTSDYVLY